MLSLFRGQPVKVLGDKRYFIFNIERIYHPDTILRHTLNRYVFLFRCVTIIFDMDIKKHLSSIIFSSVFLFSLLCLYYFIFFTNPKNLPVSLLLMPVITIFIIFFLIFYWIIRKSIFTNKKYSPRRSAFLATIYSIIPVLLLALASTKQFTLRDIIMALILFFCIVVYFSRVDFLAKK